MKECLQIHNNGEIKLPAALCRAAKLQVDDLLEVSVEEDGSIRLAACRRVLFRGAKSQFEPQRAPRTRSLKAFLSDLRVLRGEKNDADWVLRQPASSQECARSKTGGTVSIEGYQLGIKTEAGSQK